MMRGDGEAPRVDFADFVRRLDYRQGQHVSLVGPTQTGKTTLARHVLLPRRSFVVAIGTKPRDKVLEGLTKEGYRRPPRYDIPEIQQGQKEARVLLWPKAPGISPAELAFQRQVIARAWQTAYRRGNWTMFSDECSYLCRELHLEQYHRVAWQAGSSSGFGLIALTQRPAWVPRDIYSAASHLFFWNTNDDEDLRRLGGLNGINAKVVRNLVAGLDRKAHEFLYVNTQSRSMCRSVFTPNQPKGSS